MYASIFIYIYIHIFSRWLGVSTWLGVFLLGLPEDGGLEVGVFTPLGKVFLYCRGHQPSRHLCFLAYEVHEEMYFIALTSWNYLSSNYPYSSDSNRKWLNVWPIQRHIFGQGMTNAGGSEPCHPLLPQVGPFTRFGDGSCGSTNDFPTIWE